MRTWSVVALGWCLAAACGGEARHRVGDAEPGDVPDASVPDASVPDAGSSTCAGAALPEQHRAAAEACPMERGSLGALDTTRCIDRSGITCTSDADCTEGNTGRCVSDTDPCLTKCSYDGCLTDADCAAGPCTCRKNAADVAANACLPGSNCRTDADCADCEACSPSVVPNSVDCNPLGACSCGDGVATLRYACRTQGDECVTASDCQGGSSAYCAYDDGFRRWKCANCSASTRL
jgi:hypothetical protein